MPFRSHKGSRSRSLVPSFVAHYYLNDKLYSDGNFGRGLEFRGCFRALSPSIPSPIPSYFTTVPLYCSGRSGCSFSVFR